MVVGEGFEPSKAMPSDLQSDLVGHLSTPPKKWSLGSPNEGRIVPDTPKAGKHKKARYSTFHNAWLIHLAVRAV